MIWIILFFLESFLNSSIISGHKLFSKQWEYSGSISFDNSVFTFNSNHDFPYAMVYCTHTFRNDAVTNLTFKIPNKIPSFAQFAVWLVNNFGSRGEVFGGPKNFKGLGILFRISDSELSIQILDSKKLQKNFTHKFAPVFKFDAASQYFNLIIDNINTKHNSKSISNVTITLRIGDFNGIIYQNLFFEDLKKKWLGITSSTLNASNFSLLSAKITEVNETESSKQSIPISPKSKISDSLKSLSNKIENNQYQPTSSDIVKLIDRMDQTIDYISDDIDFDHILKNAMVPFTQTWQKRSIKLSKKMKQFAHEMQKELDSAEAQFETLRKDISKEIRKFVKNVSDIESKLYFSEISYEFDYNTKLKEENNNILNGTPVIKIFMVCFLETLLAMLFFVSKWIDQYFQIKRNGKKKPRAFSRNPLHKRKRRRFEA